MRAFATAEATGAGGGGGRGVVGILALVGLLVAVAFAIGWGAMQVRDTAMASDPAVAAARARQAAAEADLKAGELQRQNRAEQATAADSLTWGSRISAVGHVVEISALVAVPLEQGCCSGVTSRCRRRTAACRWSGWIANSAWTRHSATRRSSARVRPSRLYRCLRSRNPRSSASGGKLCPKATMPKEVRQSE
jgi:hypothetical protein